MGVMRAIFAQNQHFWTFWGVFVYLRHDAMELPQ